MQKQNTHTHYSIQDKGQIHKEIWNKNTHTHFFLFKKMALSLDNLIQIHIL